MKTVNRLEPFKLSTRSELEQIEYLISRQACHRYCINNTGDTGTDKILATLELLSNHFCYRLISQTKNTLISADQFLGFLKKQPYDYKGFAPIDRTDFEYKPALEVLSFLMTLEVEANYSYWPPWAIEMMGYPRSRVNSISILFPRNPGATFGVTRENGIIDPIYLNDLIVYDPLTKLVSIIPAVFLSSVA